MKIKKQHKYFLLAILLFVGLACSSTYRNSILDRFSEQVEEIFSNPGLMATKVFEQGKELDGGDAEVYVQPDPGSLSFGMGGLDSYRSRLVRTFQGTDEEGNSTTILISNEMESIPSLQIAHLLLNTYINDKLFETNELYRYGNEVYLVETHGVEAEIECSVFPNGVETFEQNRKQLELSAIFSNLFLGDLLESKIEINGIRSDHYRVTGVEMVNASLSNIQSEVWYARNEAYIVKFAGVAKGEAYSDLEESTVQGQISWAYDLLDVNQVERILLPEVCQAAYQGGSDSIPVPENVFDVSRMGSMLSFSSPEDVTYLVDYYKAEMPALGFLLSDESSSQDYFVLSYDKANVTVVVMLSALNEGGSDAIITIETK